MCFFFTHEALPSDTLLILAPVELEGSKMQPWQLTYVNNVNPSPFDPSKVSVPASRIAAQVALSSKTFTSTAPTALLGGHENSMRALTASSHTRPTLGRTSFVTKTTSGAISTNDRHGQAIHSQGTLMCVPIPNKVGMKEDEFILCALDPDDTHKVRSSASRAFKPYHKDENTLNMGIGGFSFGSVVDSSEPTLSVQQVGAYTVCVAPTYQDLKNRAPWKAFNIQDSYRNTILNGMQQMYGEDFAFVIARAETTALENSGFSIVYCNDAAYIPTAHEITAQDQHGLVEMDATIIAFNTIIDTSSICAEEQNKPPAAPGTTLSEYPIYRCDDSHCRSIPRRWSDCVDILAALPCIGNGDYHQDTLLRHERPICCVSWKLQGKMRNGDVHGRIASSDDQDALIDAMAQLDYWWVARSNGFVPRLQKSVFTYKGGDMSVWGGKVIDFILALVGRKLAYPDNQDRFSDPDPQADVSSEIFLNLDFAAERGIENTVDIDSVNFTTRKDQFLSMQDGSSAENSIYFRLAKTKLPSQFRTTKSRTTMGTNGWKRDLSFTKTPKYTYSPRGFTFGNF